MVKATQSQCLQLTTPVSSLEHILNTDSKLLIVLITPARVILQYWRGRYPAGHLRQAGHVLELQLFPRCPRYGGTDYYYSARLATLIPSSVTIFAHNNIGCSKSRMITLYLPPDDFPLGLFPGNL